MLAQGSRSKVENLGSDVLLDSSNASLTVNLENASCRFASSLGYQNLDEAGSPPAFEDGVRETPWSL